MGENSKASILVVDDNEDNLLLMRLLLQSEGYKVESANSGFKGLAAIERQCPDLVILDLMMPDITGLEIIQHLKNKCQMSNIKIMLLTANTNLRHTDVESIDALCHKPFDINQILEIIKSMLYSKSQDLDRTYMYYH